jgi:amino acid adenylation domain-containing protein
MVVRFDSDLHARDHAAQTLIADAPAACISELFERQVRRTPDAPAVFDERTCLTFGELNVRANQLAHLLRARGVKRETLVGICLTRSIDMTVAVLGVLKAGAAYVPLEPADPIARLTFIYNDCGARFVITNTRLRNRLPANASLICFDVDGAVLAKQSGSNPAGRTERDDAAYVIYTSGTTGQPKGVIGLHRGAINRFEWMWEAYPFVSGEVCCQKTSLGFVDSVAEIFVPLLKGIPLLVLDEDTAHDPRLLVEAMGAHAVTRLVLVPSLLRDILALGGVLERRLARLRICVSSGEALPVELALAFRERLPHATLLNLYGSTEVSADATCYDTRHLSTVAATVPLGQPIANTQLHILDAKGAPVPSKVAGELYVGGDGLARGYWHRPDLTAARFVRDPFSASPDARLYKTGDRVRQLADGTIEFLGRVDYQVKIRGQRVELGEIEAVLTAHPNISQAVMSARRYGPSDMRLVAYVVTRIAAAFDVENVRAHCRTRLPEQMVPAVFIRLDRLPLTASGKVNRSALPAPDAARSGRVAGAVVAPRTPLEERLVAMWEGLLGVDDVGVTDDFFDLGGHSLLAVRLATEIEDTFGRRFPVSTLAHTRTIERLAVVLGRPDAGPWSPLVPLQPSGVNAPFFLVHGMGGDLLSFRTLALSMPPTQPLYGLRAKGSDRVEELLRDVETMAACYIDAIKTVSPRGPYFIGGYSSGGTVALEMAQQLRARGEQVAALVMIDADAPFSTAGMTITPAVYLEYLRNLATWPIDDDRFWPEVLNAMDRVRHKGRKLAARLARLLMRSDVPVDNRDTPGEWQIPDEHRHFLAIHGRALASYKPREYDGPIILLRARTAPLSEWRAPDLGWSALAKGGLAIETIRGGHYNIMTEPRVHTLVAKLTAFLNAVQH